MGDRTSVTVYVWHEDKEKFLRETTRLLGEPYEDDDTHVGFHTLSYEEVNYAGWDDLRIAAGKGYRFYGFHGTGSDYEAEEFASSGDGALESVMINQESGRITTDVVWLPGQEITEVSAESMKRIGRYLLARNALLKLAAPD